MKELLNNKLFDDLLNKGELPEVEVSLSHESVVTLCIGLILSAIIIILFIKLSNAL